MVDKFGDFNIFLNNGADASYAWEYVHPLTEDSGHLRGLHLHIGDARYTYGGGGHLFDRGRKFNNNRFPPVWGFKTVMQHAMLAAKDPGNPPALLNYLQSKKYI